MAALFDIQSTCHLETKQLLINMLKSFHLCDCPDQCYHSHILRTVRLKPTSQGGKSTDEMLRR